MICTATPVGPLTTTARLRDLAPSEGAADVRERAHRSVRPVCFDADAGYVDTDVWWRPDLRAGDTVEGPAVIEEFGSTVPVHPGFVVRVDTLGNLVITRSTAAPTTTPEA